MKIKNVTPLNDGMSEWSAQALWDKIEGFAGYAFNKSHSIEYSMISYWSMWLKTNYPAEFYAAAMTAADKEDKLEGLVMDAQANGLKVMPPDINRSTDRIEIMDKVLYAPFQAIKGVSEKVAGYILEAKKHRGVPFVDKADFEAALIEVKLVGKVNKAHREKMEKVGVYASITPGAPAADSKERLKDRIEFMPGYTVENVKASRGVTNDRLAQIQIIEMQQVVSKCEGCSLHGQPHPVPRLGKSPKFMMIFDSPSHEEGKDGKVLEGTSGAYVKVALKDEGLSANDGYFTTLVKAVKPKGAKSLTNEQVNGCMEYLKKEIEVLKPPVIIAMGSQAVRYFAPSIKGGPAEYAGKVIFNAELDASVILGVNPASLHFNPSHITLVQKVCSVLSTLIKD